MKIIKIEKIKLDKQKQMLLIDFSKPIKKKFIASAEYLRVHSLSAQKEKSTQKLITGKKFICINKISLSGNYALKINFSDGHNTGLYTWNYLWDLCINQNKYWKNYQDTIKQNTQFRDPNETAIKLIK